MKVGLLLHYREQIYAKLRVTVLSLCGKHKQLGSLKFFLSHASNYLRGCLSRYTESINDSNSCLSTEEHCGSAAAEDQPLQSEQDTLCCSVCRVKPSSCNPQLSHSGMALALGVHPGALGAPSSPDGLGLTFHPGKAAWWYQGPIALPWERPGMGQEEGGYGLQRTHGFALRARGHSQPPSQLFHHHPGLGEAQDSQGRGVNVLSSFLNPAL